MKKINHLLKLHKSKSGRFVDYFRSFTAANLIFLMVMLLILTYFVNFALNQFFGTKIIPLGKPVTFMLAILAIIPVYYAIIRKQGVLDRTDFFTIGLIVAGTFTLIYYLPVLWPEIYSNPANSILSFLHSAYTDPGNPVAIWHNGSVEIHDNIQSIIPIP